MSAEIQVIGVGSPLVDSLACVDDAFIEANIPGAKGGMEVVTSEVMADLMGRLGEVPVEMAAGGSAGNTLYAMAKLGASCSMLGKLGKDSLGEYYRSTFSGVGVSGRSFKATGDMDTGRCLVLITPDSERTCRTYLGASVSLAIDEVSTADFNDVQHAHIEGYLLFNPDLAVHILDCAKTAGCSVSLDLGSFEVVNANRARLDSLLDEYVDMVFANEDEAEAFTGTEDPAATLQVLRTHCEVAAVKLGDKGALIADDTATVTIAAERVTAVDTTGAGDYWAAGFLYGRLRGWSLDASGSLAARLGAAVVQQTGASVPEIMWTEIQDSITAKT